MSKIMKVGDFVLAKFHEDRIMPGRIVEEVGDYGDGVKFMVQIFGVKRCYAFYDNELTPISEEKAMLLKLENA